jgi:hypothetical protein
MKGVGNCLSAFEAWLRSATNPWLMVRFVFYMSIPAMRQYIAHLNLYVKDRGSENNAAPLQSAMTNIPDRHTGSTLQ